MKELNKIYFISKEKTKCFKTCSKCGKTELISKFPVDRRNLDGHSGTCKECRNREQLKYYYHNRGKILIQNKIYRDTHKRERSIYSRNYQEKHKERFKVLAREFYLKNREAIIERNNKYYQDHKGSCRARKKLWRIKNKERIREYNKKYKLEHKEVTSFNQ